MALLAVVVLTLLSVAPPVGAAPSASVDVGAPAAGPAVAYRMTLWTGTNTTTTANGTAFRLADYSAVQMGYSLHYVHTFTEAVNIAVVYWQRNYFAGYATASAGWVTPDAGVYTITTSTTPATVNSYFDVGSGDTTKPVGWYQRMRVAFLTTTVPITMTVIGVAKP